LIAFTQQNYTTKKKYEATNFSDIKLNQHEAACGTGIGNIY